MKKTAIALLSVASFFCGYAHAEVDDPDSYCQTHNGYVLVEDERGNPMCVHRDALDAQMEEEAPSGQSQTCSSEFKNGIGDAGSQCESAYQTQQQQCKKSAYNKGGEIQKLETEFNAYLRKKAEDIKAGKSEYQTSCRKIEETHKKLADELKRALTGCQDAKIDCINRCNEVSGYLNALFNTASQNDKIHCEPYISSAEGRVLQKANHCRAQDTIAEMVTAQEIRLRKVAQETGGCNVARAGEGRDDDDSGDAIAGADQKDDKAGAAAVDPKNDGAGDGTGKPKENVVAGGPNGGGNDTPPATDGGGSSNGADGGSGSGSDNGDGNQQAKKSNKPNQSEIGALMGAASSLLSAFMQKSDPQQVEPVQLDPSDCRRPENMSSTICRCQVNWTPDCNGTTASAESFSSNALPGVGGAQLNKENNGSQLSLEPEQPFFDIPRKQGDLGGGGGGMYAGGGGFSPPPANFIPDNNKGRGGSGLSANILNGTYGGGMMGLGGSRGALRPVMRPRRGDGDPEELPGYKLGKKDDRPDFNSFLPPGAGVGTAGAQVPSRGISGMVGSNLQEGMHPSSTDIFKAVSNRYRQLEFTLFADK